MKFRFTALGLHLLASTLTLTTIFGLLYFGWYRWPGWFLADVSQVVMVMAGVDLVAGPLLTGVIASPAKPRRVLARDIAVIAAVQLLALGYGAVSIWNGRPLYYAFSETVLQVIQAYDIEPDEAALGRQKNPDLAPHWYSLPRWIWAPLPKDSKESDKIVAAAVSGGADVTSMPRYFKRWEDGLPQLRKQLKKVDDVGYFSGNDKKALKLRMQQAGLPNDQPTTIPLTGRGKTLLAVFDPSTMTIVAMLKPQ
jgi:hypothetical protein